MPTISDLFNRRSNFVFPTMYKYEAILCFQDQLGELFATK